MSGVTARSVASHSASQSSASSGWSQGALTHAQLEAANTGRMLGDLQSWAERRHAYERMAQDTRRMADILQAWGVAARLDEPLTAVGILGGQADPLESWRNVNVLPLVASRNRRPVVKALEYYMSQQRGWGRWRYAVVTTGSRVPLFGDLRGRLQDLHRRISKWSAEARDQFGIEVIHRQSELTCDEALTWHPHANVVYRPTRRLPKAEWSRFLAWSWLKLGAQWRDCGPVRSASEVIKYMTKGDDLALMLDAACLVDEWADEAGDPMAYVDAVELRLRARTGRPAMEAAQLVAGQVFRDLRRHGAAGQPHPLVWLTQQLHRLHLGQSSGGFRDMLRGLRDDGCKVATVWTGRGTRLQLVLRRRRHKDPERERLQRLRDLVYGKGERLPSGLAENQVICIQAPAPRFSPWCEPVAIVANYNPNPRTDTGVRNLQRLQEQSTLAARAWSANGAPPPEVARRRAAMVLSAEGPAGGPALQGGGAGPGRPYGPHLYENCPGPERPPDDDTDLRYWVLTPRGLFNPRTGEIVEHEPADQVVRRTLAAVDEALADWVWDQAEAAAREWRAAQERVATVEPDDDDRLPWWQRY